MKQERVVDNAIEYFDQQSPGMIIAGKKDGADDLGVFYSGSHQELEMLRDLINDSIDQLKVESSIC